MCYNELDMMHLGLLIAHFRHTWVAAQLQTFTRTSEDSLASLPQSCP